MDMKGLTIKYFINGLRKRIGFDVKAERIPLMRE